jgi:hypothetical protein
MRFFGIYALEAWLCKTVDQSFDGVCPDSDIFYSH